MTRRGTSSFVAVLACVMISACGEEPEPLLTEDALRQGTYLTQFLEEGRVTLTEGEFQGSVVEGVDDDLAFFLGPFALGDLNADDREDAAVVLAERDGWTRTFYSLHAVLDDDTVMRDVAWVLLGDRQIRVRDVRVDSGLISVGLLGRDAEEGEQQIARSVVYALTDKGLRPVDTPDAIRTSEASAESSESGVEDFDKPQMLESSIPLSGANWKLVAIEMHDELVTPVFSALGDPSLVFRREFGDPDVESGRISGMTGCNRIFGNYRVGPADSMSISSVALTYMSCPEPVQEIERLLVRALELTRSYRRVEDELILKFVDGQLRFAILED